MQTVTCHISSIEKLNDFLYRVFLTPTQAVTYKAGQYLSVVMGEKDKRHFSIANAPLSDMIELHIGATPENSYAMQVIEKMQSEGEIEVEIGKGDAYLREHSNRPIILVAGGTGFSYVKSLLERIVQLQLENPVYLYWGVKEYAHFYFENEAVAWAKKHRNVHFYPVIELPESQWQGDQGYVHKAVLNKFADLSAFDIYIVGRFEMAKIAREDFVKQGALVEHIFGDAFAFI
ncbi:NAD(P)H-flavin reductase [Psychromonas antarctica]|jgi:aquacobalamin reductase/NAD(P)H-flavin reductase|uniref:NAD(P)H-flavin reductase n=1 Tax=Psychromonas antarctica TaxID=67573 RepID=UPI001EE8FCC9|nr:NAD(P)H-flavin reductase [Psychromonas antarctica]MCG6202236.1 NAD(P)H-flavin reductase [Psychromonas antarctica]